MNSHMISELVHDNSRCPDFGPLRAFECRVRVRVRVRIRVRVRAKVRVRVGVGVKVGDRLI